jgi:hypothetical protein
LTQRGEFVPIARVKYVLPALVAVVCALAACETTADRRDLFAPNKPQGPYTDMLRGIASATPPAEAGAVPPGEPGSNTPPPPPPPPPPSETPDINNVGAPAATPMPVTPMVPLPVTPTPAAPAPAAPAPAAPSLSAPAPVTPAGTPATSGGGASPAPDIPGLSQ